jgi:hypothetical protein
MYVNLFSDCSLCEQKFDDCPLFKKKLGSNLFINKSNGSNGTKGTTGSDKV